MTTGRESDLAKKFWESLTRLDQETVSDCLVRGYMTELTEFVEASGFQLTDEFLDKLNDLAGLSPF